MLSVFVGKRKLCKNYKKYTGKKTGKYRKIWIRRSDRNSDKKLIYLSDVRGKTVDVSACRENEIMQELQKAYREKTGKYRRIWIRRSDINSDKKLIYLSDVRGKTVDVSACRENEIMQELQKAYREKTGKY